MQYSLRQLSKFFSLDKKTIKNYCLFLQLNYLKITDKEFEILKNWLSKYSLSERKLILKQNTLLKKYDDANYCNVEKIKQTKLKNHGDENYCNVEKIKQTKLKNHGNSNYNNVEKIKNTQSKKSKKDFDELKEKQTKTLVEKYGHNYKKVLVEKCKKSKLKNHGNSNYNNVEKIKSTNLQKYGNECFSKTSVFKKQFSKNWQEKISQFELKNNCTHLSHLNTDSYHDKQTIKSILLEYDSDFIRDEKNQLYINNDIKNKIIEKLNCVKKYSVSLGEKQICEFLENNVAIEKNNRNILNGEELDIYIPSKKLAIEFNGLYWHSDLFKDKNYHLNKTLACEEKEIRLIHIFEDEWTNKKEICKSIINSALGIYEQKIFARKCTFEKISNEKAKEFLNKNHIQGSVNGEHYGLIYDDDLVQIISLGKSRFKKNEMELYRMCTKLNTQVVGGFSKLMKHQPYDEIISYVDKRLFDGKGYEKSNFEFVSNSSPNYFYVKNGERFNRLKFQKHKLINTLKIFNANLSEKENMNQNGYSRIYDCGNLKLCWKRKPSF